MPLCIKKQEDFRISADNVKKFDPVSWNKLIPVGGTKNYRTDFKLLYSETGIYGLFRCEDKMISCSGLPDGGDLYTEDVLELFIQPDIRYPIYMEYELSPLNKELLLMVSHNGEAFYGWLPFHYSEERKTVHITWSEVDLAEKVNCREWYAMLYIPFALFEGVSVKRPVSGTVWRGNVFRIDYDNGETSRFAWEQECKTEFHDYRKYAEFVFE